MPENSKLQPAKLGKNFDPVDHSNRNFFFSLILSVLLHWLIYFLFEHREDFFPSKPKLVKFCLLYPSYAADAPLFVLLGALGLFLKNI
ncbi:hypothetical protein AV922_0202810 [Helicobacter pylori]|nr:hypothetical protein AV922_0202810 [Helicobacter pylori]